MSRKVGASDAILGDILASRDLGSNSHQAPCARRVVREVSEQPLGKLTSLRGGREGEGPLELCLSHRAHLTGLVPGQEGRRGGRGGRQELRPPREPAHGGGGCDLAVPQLSRARLVLSPCVTSLLTRSVTCSPDRWSWSICGPRC